MPCTSFWSTRWPWPDISIPPQSAHALRSRYFINWFIFGVLCIITRCLISNDLFIPGGQWLHSTCGRIRCDLALGFFCSLWILPWFGGKHWTIPLPYLIEPVGSWYPILLPQTIYQRLYIVTWDLWPDRKILIIIIVLSECSVQQTIIWSCLWSHASLTRNDTILSTLI